MSENQSGYALGFGSAISYALLTAGTYNTPSGAYTLVAQTLDLMTPKPETPKIKVTNNQSPNNSHEYAAGGLTEPGDTEFDVIFVKSEHLTLLQMQGNGIIYSWKETFLDGTNYTWPGFVASASVETKTEDEANKGKLKIQAASAGFWS
jgi:hypothetical protein